MIRLYLYFLGTFEFLDLSFRPGCDPLVLYIEVFFEMFEFCTRPIHISKTTPKVRHPVFVASPSSAPTAVSTSMARLVTAVTLCVCASKKKGMSGGLS